ncbi:MAG TPA: FtsK/SpoIIIE domain-containing protein [Blastococcus sp.]|nr:FtsK/SpoIIIE domain-containing protein [Blastococcus sp.]
MTDPATSDPAALRASRCWTLVSPDGSIDVELVAGDDDRLSDVLDQLSRVLGVPAGALWAGSTRLAVECTLAAPELRHGAVLGLGRPVPPDARCGRSSALELHVVGGPDAGRTVPLGQGRHVVGRGSEATVRLDDPDVSRRHALVQVGGGSITVADLGSTNGSRLAADELDDRPRPWPTGEILRIGTTALTVSGPVASPAAVDGSAAGRVRLRPMPARNTPRPEVEVSFPRAPAPPPHRRLAWVTVALPAAGGILMALVLHTPSFLFFALLSPVVALGTWLSERTSGRRAGRRNAAAYAADLVAAEARLAAAVRADGRAADAAAPDLAAITTAARRRSRLLWSRGRDAADALVVRIGTGPGSSGVLRIQSDGSRVRETAAHLPVLADLRPGGGLGVVGPRERALGVLRGVLAQVTALHAPGDVELLLLAGVDRLHEWSWARWLPHLAPGGVHLAGRSAGGSPQGSDDALNAWLMAVVRRRRALLARRPGDVAATGWLVVVVDRPLDPRVAATLTEARDAGVVTLSTAESAATLPVQAGAVLLLSGETGDVAVLSGLGSPDNAGVAVDRLAAPTAAEFARDLAGLAAVSSAGSLPSSVRLLDLPADGLRPEAAGGLGGTWSTARDRLVATLGRTAEGPVQVDLCRQGPHALIAGTTGSGKSELLQTLIVGLALTHPPDRCSFLLVDYKGGAAFAEAAALPHTVGLVTDLDGQTTARALRSLAAELTRREAVLGEHGVADIAALPATVDLARLVIVVDEFATLVDELPSFVPGLVSIAQRGRSLGVHLVLATQRPSGVVSPEIRANCTLRICLRTTDESDSRDVLGTPDAAFLPVEVPGRAFLRAGSGEPTALQVARVATTGRSRAAVVPEVRRWTWPLTSPSPAGTTGRDGDTDLARLTRAIARHAAETAVRLPHRPWRPPLPDVLPATSTATDTDTGTGAARAVLRIGLVDRPDTQSQHPLELDLADGGTWVIVGGARSGRTTALRTVLGEAVGRLGPDELHVHVVESSGGALAADAAVLPHAGTTIGGGDALRTVRLVDRLAGEVADRRAGAGTGTSPLILLLLDGIESIAATLDEADPGRGSSNLHRLLRDGAAVGVTCVLTADRAVPGGRLASVARHRLVLPLPDRADYAVAGVAARDVPTERPPGRALLGENALECQISLPRPLPAPGAGGAARGTVTALRIAELPPDPCLPLPDHHRAAEAGAGALRLPLGPGGDDGQVLTVDLLRTGGLLVAGPPGSGRSAALDAFAGHLVGGGVPVLRIGTPPGSPAESRCAPADQTWVDQWNADAVTGWLERLGGRPGVVIADDIGAPADAPALGRLPAPGAAGRVALVAAASAGQLSAHFQGAVAALRRGRSGVLLCPGPGDADLLGVRLPRTPIPVRPGSGWLVIGGAAERVQLARRRSARGDDLR